MLGKENTKNEQQNKGEKQGSMTMGLSSTQSSSLSLSLLLHCSASLLSLWKHSHFLSRFTSQHHIKNKSESETFFLLSPSPFVSFSFFHFFHFFLPSNSVFTIIIIRDFVLFSPLREEFSFCFLLQNVCIFSLSYICQMIVNTIFIFEESKTSKTNCWALLNRLKERAK